MTTKVTTKETTEYVCDACGFTSEYDGTWGVGVTAKCRTTFWCPDASGVVKHLCDECRDAAEHVGICSVLGLGFDLSSLKGNE